MVATEKVKTLGEMATLMMVMVEKNVVTMGVKMNMAMVVMEIIS